MGPGNDGGGILDQCSGFGVNAFSPPNFLAYNAFASYSNGGLAKLPNLILFPAATNAVSMMVSDGNEPDSPMGIVALGPGGVVGFAQCQMVPREWMPCRVAGEGIRAIIMIGQTSFFVVDDVTF
jgi:hypothetical protein